jgi:hypothetical protein
VVLDVYLLTIVVTVFATLCVVGVLSGQELRNMRKRSSMVRRPHTFRGGGHWCPNCEQIHRMIGQAVVKFRTLPPEEQEAARGKPSEPATGKPFPKNVKPYGVN